MDGGYFSDVARLREHLTDRYGIRPGKVTQLDQGGVFRVDRKQRPAWVARVFQEARPIARTEGDADVLRFLEAEGYPAERCAHAVPVSTLDGRPVLVTEFADGAPLGEGGRSMVPLWAFEVLGDLLGKLHTMSDLPAGLKRDGGSWHGDPLHEGLPRKDISAALSWLASVEDRVPEQGRGPYESLREQVATADDGHDLPRTLVHPDFVPVNIIATPGGRVTIVDWTGTGLGPRVNSFANLLLAVDGKHEGSLNARIDAVVGRYRAHVWLEDDELARLAGAMRIRPVLFACWYYHSSVSSGYTPTGREPWWPDDKPINRIARSARAAFGADVLPRPDPKTELDTLKPEIPGQLALDVTE